MVAAAVRNAADQGLAGSHASRLPHHALHRFAQVTTLATFLLIVAGGLVTSTGSGLSVPDWPLSFGRFFPPMKGGVFFEHGHRMIAGTVGILVSVLAFWVSSVENRRWVRILGFAALGAIVCQALLGGITVLFKLPAPVSVLHACLAQAVLCMVAALAWATSPMSISKEQTERTHPETGSTSEVQLKRTLPLTAPVLTAVLIYVQLVLGAVLRHTGLALIPHIIGASLVTASIAWTSISILRNPSTGTSRDRHLRPLAWFAPILVVTQVTMGLTLILRARVVWLTTAHVAVGALLLVTMVVTSLISYLGRRPGNLSMSESDGGGASR